MEENDLVRRVIYKQVPQYAKDKNILIACSQKGDA
jgi:hypothetical protein